MKLYFVARIETLLSKIFTYICIQKGVKINRNALIYYKCSINFTPSSIIKIGRSTQIGRSRKNYHAGMPFNTTLLVDVPGAFINIGERCRIFGAYIHAQKGISIGNNCLIAAGVNILDCNGHELYSLDRTVGRDSPENIIIGNNVWIGVNSIILKGTEIGENSCVAAGSVVKGVFPKNSLIQGNPAKVVKELVII